MRKYYRYYYADFSNTFKLISTNSKSEEESLEEHFFKRGRTYSILERVPLKTALHICAAERKLRKVNPEAAGYSPTEITPFSEYMREEKMEECYE